MFFDCFLRLDQTYQCVTVIENMKDYEYGPPDKYGRRRYTANGKHYRTVGGHPRNCDCPKCLEMREMDRKYDVPYETRVDKSPPDQNVADLAAGNYPVDKIAGDDAFPMNSRKGGSWVSGNSLNNIYKKSDEETQKKKKKL